MRLAWLTDIHLNFLTREQRFAFAKQVNASQPDAVLIGGDISDAPRLLDTLELLTQALTSPIYFVLGNHDFYRGSIRGVRAAVASLCQRQPNLTWLSASHDPVRLTKQTTLIGHDGWGDGGFGNSAETPVALNDFLLIEELAAAESIEQRLGVMRRLGEEAAEHLRRMIASALQEEAEEVLVLTHVPPFREAAWHEGRESDADWLPFFACKAVGEVLRQTMENHPQRKMLVLCGHTHGEGECAILPNLQVWTGGAEYRRPSVQGILEIA